jgi:hypothetical protein
MSRHTCHAEGCPVKVPPKLFVCAKHWRMVPVSLQRELWRVYQPGQEAGKAPVTTAYLVVQTRCRIAIAEREGRDLTDLQRQLATFERMAAGEKE